MPKAFSLKPLAAEFVGTFLLVFVATGVIMANEISGGQITHLGIGLSTGLAISVIIFALGHVSGAHINPAVTFGFALGGHLPWRKVPGYVVAQMAGGILASAVLLALLGSVAHQGANLPAVGASQALGLEVVLTFLLMLVIVAVATDSKAQGQLAALAIGATVALEIIFAWHPLRLFHESRPLPQPRPHRLDMDQPVDLRRRSQWRAPPLPSSSTAGFARMKS